MPQTWDVSPWVIAAVAGPVVLALALAYGINHDRGRRPRDGRRSPDFDSDATRQDRAGRSDQG